MTGELAPCPVATRTCGGARRRTNEVVERGIVLVRLNTLTALSGSGAARLPDGAGYPRLVASRSRPSSDRVEQMDAVRPHGIGLRRFYAFAILLVLAFAN